MTATVFRQSYMTQRRSLFTLICHCVFICSNFRSWLAYCMRWLLWCFCLSAESYETKNHYHYHASSWTYLIHGTHPIMVGE